MQRFARVAFSTSDGLDAFGAIQCVIDEWINSKGAIVAPDRLVAHDGRELQLHRDTVISALGEVRHTAIVESTRGGRFRTTLTSAVHERHVAFMCDVEGGQEPGVIAPTVFDVHVPRVVGDVLRQKYTWSVGHTPVRATPYAAVGGNAGAELARHLQASTRNVPVVVISSWEGSLLEPRIHDGTAKDLVGLAQVWTVDEDAAWALTEVLGKELSCYQGAIRLYWPGGLSPADPYRHPLWTSMRLLEGRSPGDAARLVRSHLRSRVYPASSLALEPDAIIGRIESEHRKELLRSAKSANAEQLADLFDELATKNEELESKLAEAQEEIQVLRIDKVNLEALLDVARGASPSALTPATFAPPDSVASAVDQARLRWSDDLIFGNDVEDGTASVDADSGPPDKILRHLEALAGLAAGLRKGRLGKTIAAWLSERGVPTSQEYPQTMKNHAERERRTWHDGNVRRPFELHTKPSDGVTPGRCVRIYFDWAEAEGKIVVAWVGRKPGV